MDRSSGPRAEGLLNCTARAGVLSTTSVERGRPTVLDIIPERCRRLRVYPVGRLDAETSGHLFLTDDDDLANRITHPPTTSRRYTTR